MKHLLFVLALSISAPLYAGSAFNASAPNSDQSLTVHKNAQELAEYDSSDAISSGQAATSRELYNDNTSTSCRNTNGVWLSPGEAGYTTCMNDTEMLKK